MNYSKLLLAVGGKNPKF